MTSVRAALVAWSFVASLSACDDRGELAPIEPTPDEIDDLVVCDGITFARSKVRDEVTTECRESVEGLIEPSSNFLRRLVVLGFSDAEDGARTVYLIGANENGQAFSSEELARARVEITLQDDSTVAVESEELDVAALTERDGQAFAVAIANDYSKTMRDDDLDAVAAAERALLGALPRGFEASVLLFSTEVRLTLPTTPEAERIDAGLGIDESVSRERTALYDGLSRAVTLLAESPRPVRVLFVASDGPDNESREASRSDVAAALSEHRIAGWAASALFSDAEELRSMFGARGAVFQVPSMQNLPGAITEYASALRNGVRLVIPGAYAGAVRYRVAVDDVGVVVR